MTDECRTSAVNGTDASSQAKPSVERGSAMRGSTGSKPMPPLANQLAKASWAAPVIMFFMMAAMRHQPPGTGTQFVDVLSLLLPVAGLAMGVAAMVSWVRRRREGILSHALVGICLSGFFVAVLSVGFAQAIRRHSPEAVLATTVEDLRSKLPSWDGAAFLTRVDAGPNELRLEYTYTVQRADLDLTFFSSTRGWYAIRQDVCDGFDALFRRGISVHSRYHSSEGMVVGELHYEPADCGY